MSIFLYGQGLKRKMESDLVGRLSMKKALIAKVAPRQEKQLAISTSTVLSCLYERKQPEFIETDNARKGGGSDLQLWCLLCRKKYTAPCPIHGLSYASREDNGFHKSKAVRSLPPEVCLCRSSVPGAELGVCTRKHIPAGTWIGPYEGKRVRPDDVKPGMDTSFMWEIFEGDKLKHFIDGSDEECSSWMRFIQCARSKDEQNLFAFQYKDNVYYRSFKDIAVGEELLVWYDDKYLQHFGIPTGMQEMCFVTNNGGVSETYQKVIPPQTSPQKAHVQAEQNLSGALIETQRSTEQGPQQPSRATTNLLTRTLSTDSNLTDQRSSPTSDVDSDVSDPGNNLLAPVPKSPPVGELTSWQCQQCHKTFTQRVALQLHVCPCQPDKPYQCGQCSLSFSNPSHLRAHVISHSSEKPFKCGFCSRAFAGATTLNNHIRSHMGQKPFGCEKCGKTFSQPGLLARHARNPRECKNSVSPSTVVA